MPCCHPVYPVHPVKNCTLPKPFVCWSWQLPSQGSASHRSNSKGLDRMHRIDRMKYLAVILSILFILSKTARCQSPSSVGLGSFPCRDPRLTGATAKALTG